MYHDGQQLNTKQILDKDSFLFCYLKTDFSSEYGSSFKNFSSRVGAYICLKSESVSHSVISDSLQCHGLQPARFLCPWNAPGKNTGVGCHSLLQGIFLTHELNPGLLHCRQILYCLRLQSKPILSPLFPNLFFFQCLKVYV